MKKEFIKGVLKKAGDKFEFVASDETKDRHGDVIPLDSWDLANFLKAPRMLVDHDHRVEKIVGKWEDVHIDKAEENKGLKMTAIFHKITDLSKETMEMVAKGFLNTVSVGFIPHRDVSVGEDNEEVFVQRNELLEVSLVTVPANPNAEQIKSLLEKKEKEEAEGKINEFMGEVKNIKKDNQDVLCAGCKKVIKNEIDKATEKQIKITPKPKEKSNKSRSFSSDAYKAEISKQALKEAVKILSFALSKHNQKT